MKHIEAPYVFDWEHGKAVNPMQGIWASSSSEEDVSWDFSSSGRILEYILELQRAAKSGLLSS